MQTASSRIWTQVTESISKDYNRHAINAGHDTIIKIAIVSLVNI